MKNRSTLEKHVKASLVVTMSNKLLSKKAGTTTTLDVKNALIKKHPEYKWTQKFVSDCMAALADDGALSFTDNGTFRTYTFKVTTKVRSSKSSTTSTQTSTPAAPKLKASKSNSPAKAKRISKTKALDLMSSNKGRFFTAEFVDKKGLQRVINCQYLKDQGTPKLGYVKVKEAALMRTESDPKKAIRQINLQTITSLKVGGVLYKIN